MPDQVLMSFGTHEGGDWVSAGLRNTRDLDLGPPTEGVVDRGGSTAPAGGGAC